VTIGGASAGGASVDLHLSAYGGRDDGLFHAAAAESQSFGAQYTVEESQYQYDALIDRVGCNNTSDTLACLRSVDVALIALNNQNLPTPGGGGAPPNFMYSNVLDGDFTPDYTYNLFAQGKFVRVPVIFGYVFSTLSSHDPSLTIHSDDTNEGTIFTPTTLSSQSEMNSFLQDNWINITSADLTQIDQYYPQAEQFPGTGAYWRAGANAYGEIRYICPGIFISSMADKYGVDSWNYQYVPLHSSCYI
jgi:carboxylesterase type B